MRSCLAPLYASPQLGRGVDDLNPNRHTDTQTHIENFESVPMEASVDTSEVVSEAKIVPIISADPEGSLMPLT